MRLAVATAALVALVAVTEARARISWLRAYVTAYSTRENLTGCRTTNGRRACWMACGGVLRDSAFTVASNPRLGLRCGTRLEICGHGCHYATVTDRTGSRFDMELSRALAIATGAPRFAFDAPRMVVWRIV